MSGTFRSGTFPEINKVCGGSAQSSRLVNNGFLNTVIQIQPRLGEPPNQYLPQTQPVPPTDLPEETGRGRKTYIILSTYK